MSPHIFSTKSAPIDGSALAVFRNRSRYIEQSAATVGRLPMTPPVPRNRSLVPLPAAGPAVPPTAPAVGIYRDLCDDLEPDLPCGYTAPTHYLEF